MTESANVTAAALDATVVTGTGPERSRLERAATAWEFANGQLLRARSKVAKMVPQLEDARRYLAEAQVLADAAGKEFEAARKAIGAGS